MARRPRLTLAGHVHHLIQRGNNGQAVFVDTADYQRMLEVLRQQAQACGVAVHGYVLMPNHLHVLATPQEDTGLARMMQALGRSYVRYFNQRHQRSGTLWEGRYRCTVLQPERYLVPCMVYMDLNPVRAGLCPQAQDYAWSSYGHYSGARADPLVSAHPQAWALGNTPFAREARYTELVQAGVDGAHQAALTDAALRGWALGDAGFVANLQKLTPRRVSKGQAGRPIASKSA